MPEKYQGQSADENLGKAGGRGGGTCVPKVGRGSQRPSIASTVRKV